MRHSSILSSDSSMEEIPDTERGISIELKNVHFHYPTHDTPIFTGLNLTIRNGQFVAFVGL